MALKLHGKILKFTHYQPFLSQSGRLTDFTVCY